MEPNKDFLEGIKLFNSGKYFECHEVLEDLWKKTDDNDCNKKFFQGIIQVAVALHLVQEKRLSGAKKTFERAKANLSNYRQNIAGINLEKLLAEVSRYIESEGKTEKPIL